MHLQKMSSLILKGINGNPFDFVSLTKSYIDRARLFRFYPKIEINLTIGNFIVKTATSSEELMDVFRLRQQIFSAEYAATTTTLSDIDIDKYDSICDHIILKDKTTQQVIGTYRLISSEFSEKFYSQNEFKINKFLKNSTGIKLELGRACIHSNYRTGQAIHAIWKGLGAYIVKSKAKYLFGCSSLPTTNSLVAKQIVSQLGTGGVTTDFSIKPTRKYRFPNYKNINIDVTENQSSHLVPSLLKSYINAGARVYGDPAVDLKFGSTDVFTVLDVDTINPKYRKKYLNDSI